MRIGASLSIPVIVALSVRHTLTCHDREFGGAYDLGGACDVACEPVVKEPLGDLRQAGVIHADEPLWNQRGRLRGLWVVLYCRRPPATPA
jgi:hypothetical protein